MDRNMKMKMKMNMLHSVWMDTMRRIVTSVRLCAWVLGSP